MGPGWSLCKRPGLLNVTDSITHTVNDVMLQPYRSFFSIFVNFNTMYYFVLSRTDMFSRIAVDVD